MRRRCGPPPLLQPFISRVPGSSTQLLHLLSAFSRVNPPGRHGSPSRVLPLSILGSLLKVACSGHGNPIILWAVFCLCSALRLTAGVHHQTCDSLQGSITGPALDPLLSTVSADQKLNMLITVTLPGCEVFPEFAGTGPWINPYLWFTSSTAAEFIVSRGLQPPPLSACLGQLPSVPDWEDLSTAPLFSASALPSEVLHFAYTLPSQLCAVGTTGAGFGLFCSL